MAISEQASRPAPHEETYTPPPIETLIERSISEQAVIDLLKALPVPIIITQETDPRRGKPYYTYQVGEKTTDHPMGYGMGATRHFLDAVEMSLEAALTQGQSLIPPRREYNL